MFYEREQEALALTLRSFVCLMDHEMANWEKLESNFIHKVSQVYGLFFCWKLFSHCCSLSVCKPSVVNDGVDSF